MDLYGYNYADYLGKEVENYPEYEYYYIDYSVQEMNHTESSKLQNYVNLLTSTYAKQYKDGTETVSEAAPITIIYLVIFVIGFIGNITTFLVIAFKSYMRNSTNAYLFSLAISDLLIIATGIPFEIYELWHRFPYTMGDTICKIRHYLDDLCAYTSILTITVFTIARYHAVCNASKSATTHNYMANKRPIRKARRRLIIIWILASLLAIPVCLQYEVRPISVTFPVRRRYLNETTNETFIIPEEIFTLQIKLQSVTICAFRPDNLPFLSGIMVTSAVLFIMPMTLVIIMYIRIAQQIRTSTQMLRRHSSLQTTFQIETVHHRVKARQNAIKILVAVVATFFVCWTPFYVQRITYVVIMHYYPEDHIQWPTEYVEALNVFYYVSGVLLFLSCAANPVLYSILSPRFRQAFSSLARDPTQCCRTPAPRHRPIRRFVWSNAPNKPEVQQQNGDESVKFALPEDAGCNPTLKTSLDRRAATVACEIAIEGLKAWHVAEDNNATEFIPASKHSYDQSISVTPVENQSSSGVSSQLKLFNGSKKSMSLKRLQSKSGKRSPQIVARYKFRPINPETNQLQWDYTPPQPNVVRCHFTDIENKFEYSHRPNPDFVTD